MNVVNAGEARRTLHSGGEIAFLDVREAGQFIEAHALFAVPFAFSELEINAPALLPRRDVPILLIDDGDGVSELAAERLEDLGYSNIAIIQGGMSAWQAGGFPTYKGVNVPSKTLGEMAEQIWHPKMMTPDELASAMDNVDAPLFIDGRPPSEFAKMTVPGALSFPNGELAHRIEIVTQHNGHRPIVITCAGRTRGIIGSIGLKLSGYDGDVFALENGTQGWALSGRTLKRGNMPAPLPELDTASRKKSRQAANNIIERFNLNHITVDEALSLTAEVGRSNYVFDLRTHDEAAQKSVIGATVASGVQLVQATDQYVGTRRSRLIICCDTGLRSAIAAFWLNQLGYETHIIILDECETAPAFPRPEQCAAVLAQPTISRAELKQNWRNAILIDVRASKAYRAGHATGAIWAVRPRLDLAMTENRNHLIIFIGDDGESEHAMLCAKDALHLGYKNVFVLEGGHAAVVKSGIPIEVSPNNPPDSERIDFAFFVHDRHDGNLEASREYLNWETGLIRQLDDQERNEFHLSYP